MTFNTIYQMYCRQAGNLKCYLIRMLDVSHITKPQHTLLLCLWAGVNEISGKKFSLGGRLRKSMPFSCPEKNEQTQAPLRMD